MKNVSARQLVLGAFLVVFVLCGRLLYICDLKIDGSACHNAIGDKRTREESTWRPQTQEEEKWEREKLKMARQMLLMDPRYQKASIEEKRIWEQMVWEEVRKHR